jgi:hypothetical protein
MCLCNVVCSQSSKTCDWSSASYQQLMARATARRAAADAVYARCGVPAPCPHHAATWHSRQQKPMPQRPHLGNVFPGSLLLPHAAGRAGWQGRGMGVVGFKQTHQRIA